MPVTMTVQPTIWTRAWIVLALAGLVLTEAAVVRPAEAQLGWLFGKQNLGDVLTAKEAHEKALSGDIVLVDVRSSAEWRESGVGASAHAISMHQDPQTFVTQLTEAMGGDRSKPLAVICATGSRTTYLQGALKKLGFSQPINVVEGMMGSGHGPGWIRQGLPVRAWRNSADSAPGTPATE